MFEFWFGLFLENDGRLKCIFMFAFPFNN